MNEVSFTDLLSTIVDNRGRTCPVSEEGLALIATNCISNERLYPSYDTERKVSEETYKSWFRGHPIPGDLIFVCKGSPGRVCIAPDPVDFCIAQDMVALRPDATKVYPKYLFAALRSPLVQSRIENMHVGTLIPHFKKGDFGKLTIPVPDDHSLQEGIGDLYFLTSARVEQNRRTVQMLEKLARAIFRAWFVDFEPVKAKAAGATDFPSMPQSVFDALPTTFVDSDIGPVPEGWDVKPFSGVCVLVSGGTPKRSEPLFWKGGVPWYSVKDAPDDGGVWVVVTSESISEEGLSNSAARLIPKAGTIISARGTVGKLAMAGVPMAFNQSCYGVLPRDEQSFCYLYLLMQTAVAQLQQRTHGSVFETITRTTFDGLTVVAPKPEIVADFERVIAPLFNLMLALKQESTKLAEVRDFLLPKLLSGTVKVEAGNG